ncbi:Enhancer of polycomb-like protein 1 [Orbilia brochopaga]|uniref:Enhancer of polycomb-like protein n=1 Tax=Orbilia brochopaga TaxID=3140254 RepID=A0AAV9UUX3_9PEZI
MTATRFRQRKLSTKAALQVIDDSQIDVTDDDTRHIATIESGVERTEEVEHHLQAAISAANAAALGTKVKAAFIPTPDASKVIPNYDNLYRKVYSHPHSYIRFSSTVEDTSGSLYCIDEEDDEFLAQYNSKRSQGTQCSEEKFEEAISEYEMLTSLKQPFLGLSEDENLPIHLMTYEEMEEAAFESDSKLADNPWAKDLYTWWEQRRVKRKGKPLMPILKFEQGQIDKDDGDPYVCFRRREHRPARKTRRTDAQSIDKLKRLRLDMERVRSLANCVHQREDSKKENQVLEAKVYLTRFKLKKYKRDFGITGDDDDLVNKVGRAAIPKTPHDACANVLQPRNKRVVEQMPAPAPKAVVRHDFKPPEADLVQLEDLHKLRRQNIEQLVLENRKKRQSNNAGWRDQTVEAFQKPLFTPPPDRPQPFRQVRTYYARQLLSPPPSASPSLSPSSPTPRTNGVLQPRITFQTASPTPAKRKREEEDESEAARFRIRTGRNGRLMIDRRGMKLSKKDAEHIDERVLDRFAFDHDDSDEDQDELPAARAYNRDNNLLFTANLFLQQVMPRRHDGITQPLQSPATTYPNSQVNGNGGSGLNGHLSNHLTTPITPSAPHAPSPRTHLP